MNSQGLGQNGKNKKNKVVLKLKRKREDVPEETIVVEERGIKKAKVSFIDAFRQMGFEDAQPKSKTLFRYLGSEGSNNFDLNARLKEVREIEKETLPVVYPKKQGVIIEQSRKKENKNIMPGLITKKEKTEGGYDIIEIDHSSVSMDDAHEYHYYYVDEITNVDKYAGEVLTIQFESFFVNDEIDEYDQDEVFSGDEEEIDYPSSESEGDIHSWERGSSDDGWEGRGAGPHCESSEDDYDDYY